MLAFRELEPILSFTFGEPSLQGGGLLVSRAFCTLQESFPTHTVLSVWNILSASLLQVSPFHLWWFSDFLFSGFLYTLKNFWGPKELLFMWIIYIYIYFFFSLINLFIYFWLRWVFVAANGLSLVAASGGYSSLWYAGFSLRWLLLLRSLGSKHEGFSSCGTRAQ